MKWKIGAYLTPTLVLIFNTAAAQMPPAPWEDVQVGAALRKRESSKEVAVEYSHITKVILYRKTYCRDCEKVEELLAERGVDYEKRSINDTLGGWLQGTLGIISAPTTVFVYSNGSTRKVQGYDREILMTLTAPEPGSVHDSFDVRKGQ